MALWKCGKNGTYLRIALEGLASGSHVLDFALSKLGLGGAGVFFLSHCA